LVKSIKADPLVSVVVPTYNRSKTVKRAVKSVLGQTYQKLELIVVDDGSTDNTEEVINSFEDGRIRYISHDKNKGGSAARNTGIRRSEGGLIALLDSDDEWLPRKLEKQVSLWRQCSNSVGLVYCPILIHDHQIKHIIKPNRESKEGYVYRELLHGWTGPTTSSVTIRKEVFQLSGLFDEGFPSYQDYDLWIRIAKHYNFQFVDNYFVIYHSRRNSNDQISYDPEARRKGTLLFLEKWGEEIREKVGGEHFDNFRKKRLVSFHRKFMTYGKRKEVFSHLWEIVHLSGIRTKDLVKALLFMIGGRDLINFARRAKSILAKVFE